MSRVLSFSDALESYHQSQHLKRFRNLETCKFCKQEFVEDSDYQVWYPEAEVRFGEEPPAYEEVSPVNTQFGWFCSQGCFHDFVLENQIDEEIGGAA